MNKRTLAVVPVALLMGASLGAVAPAQAAAPERTTAADLLGVVTYDPADPDVGHVTARYRCFGEGSLWVSVKQTADRTADPALTGPESSQVSATWLHSHRNPVTCDGRQHTSTFEVDGLEYGQGGDLVKGMAYVQFCLFDDNHPELPPPIFGEPLSVNEFLKVRPA